MNFYEAISKEDIINKRHPIGTNAEKYYPYLHISPVKPDILTRTGLRIKDATAGGDHEYSEKRVHLFSAAKSTYCKYIIIDGVCKPYPLKDQGADSYETLIEMPAEYMSDVFSDADLSSMINDVIYYRCEVSNLKRDNFYLYACKLTPGYPVYQDTIMSTNKARYITQNIPGSNITCLGNAYNLIMDAVYIKDNNNED